MSLYSKTFQITKGQSLSSIDSFLQEAIGYDAYLIADLQAESITSSSTVITIVYSSSSTIIVDALSPREGSVLTTGLASPGTPVPVLPEEDPLPNINVFDLRYSFSKPVDPNSIVSGTFIVNSVPLGVNRYSVESPYIIRVDVGDYFYNNSSDYIGHHEIRIDTDKIKYLDGSSFEHTPVHGFSVSNNTYPYLGDLHEYKKRGQVSLGVIRVVKSVDIKSSLDQFLSSKGIALDNLLKYTIVSTDSGIEIYFLYISNSEPVITQGYPLKNTILPRAVIPENLLLTYSEELDPSSIEQSGAYILYSDFSDGSGINPNYISLLSDNRTVAIQLSGIITDDKLYSILSNTGIKSVNGFIKQKPELWNIAIGGDVSDPALESNYVYRDGSRSFTGTISGVTPTSAQHLATKAYVDGAISGENHHEYIVRDGSRSFTGDVKFGDPAGGDRSLYIHSTTSASVARIKNTTAGLYVHASGAGRHLYLDSDANINFRPYGASTIWAVLNSSALSLGSDGSHALNAYLWSATPGAYTRLTHDSINAYGQNLNIGSYSGAVVFAPEGYAGAIKFWSGVSEFFNPIKFHTLTNDQISSLSPSTAWTLYNTTSTYLQYYNGSAWKSLEVTGHTHDDRYYTKSQVDDIITGIPEGNYDHGTLTGRYDDDHPQYILGDGSRPFSGDVSIGTSGVSNRSLYLYSSSSTTYGSLRSTNGGFYLSASGDAHLYLDTPYNIYFRPNGGVNNYATLNSAALSLGSNGSYAVNLYLWSSTTGTYLRFTQDAIYGHGGNLNVFAYSGAIILRPYGTNGMTLYSGVTEFYSPIKPYNATTTQRDALSPSSGWTLYNTTTSYLNYYNGSAWKALEVTGHNHDTLYSLTGHNHDASYSPLVHNHDSSYSLTGHNHNTLYYTQAQVDALLTGVSEGTYDHGVLTGRSDDDHPQYVLGDGTRAFSGDVSIGQDAAGGYSLTLYGTQTNERMYLDTDASNAYLSTPGLDLRLSGTNTYLDASSAIYFRPGGGSQNYGFWSSSALGIGRDGQVAGNAYLYSTTTGIYLQVTAEQWKAYNTNLHIGSTNGYVIFRPNGAATNYLTLSSGWASFATPIHLWNRTSSEVSAIPSPFSGLTLYDTTVSRPRFYNGSSWSTVEVTGHNHDSAYSAIGHNHDSSYSLTGHNHDSDYSLTGHTHDDRYYTESEVDALLTGLSGSIPTSHSSLTNLSADDHTHYILVDGSRAFTGNVTVGNDGGGDRTLRINSSVVGDYATLTTASNAVTLSAVGTGNDLILVAADDIHLRPTGLDVLIGTDGSGEYRLTIYGDVASTSLQMWGAGSSGNLRSYGTSLNIWSDIGISFIVDADSASITALQLSSVGVATFSSNITLGTDAGGDRTLTIYSSVAGDYFTLTTASNAVTLTAVGTGNELILVAAGDIHLRPTGGDVRIGTAGGGVTALTVYSPTSGDHFYLSTATNSIVLDAVGCSLYLDADTNVWLRPAGGTVYIGTDAGGNQTLLIYSSVAGDYGTLTTASNAVTLSSVGSGADLLLNSAYNLYLNPAAGYTYIGTDGGVVQNLYVFSDTVGESLHLVPGSHLKTSYNTQLNRIAILDGGGVSTSHGPVNFRFDNDALAYAYTRSLVGHVNWSISFTGGFESLSQGQKEDLFGYTQDYVNLNSHYTTGQPMVIEFTGLAESNSSNARWWPYLLWHGNYTSTAYVGLEIQNGAYGWETVYTGAPKGYYQLEEYTATGGGVLRGARFTFSGVSASSYLRKVGVYAPYHDSYQWTVTKGKDAEIYGKVKLWGGADVKDNLLENVATPVSSTDAATKGYVDTSISSYSGALSSGYFYVAPPTNLSLTEVAGEVLVAFTGVAGSTIQHEIWQSEGGTGSYSLIGAVPPLNNAGSIGITDNTYLSRTDIFYAVYATSNGVKSTPLTGVINVTGVVDDVTNMSVVPMEDCYFVQYEVPQDRRLENVVVKLHQHAALTGLDEGSAYGIYTGLNPFYMYKIPTGDISLYHKFWVYTNTY